MSWLGLRYPNDNVLEERIEWNSISNRTTCLLVAYWRTTPTSVG